MTLKNYAPIDYYRWDFSGKGHNIWPYLNDTEKIFWELALQYQDKRYDSGHAEAVTYFAIQLLRQGIQADRSVVVIAAIGHDVGWSQVPEEDREKFVRLPLEELKKWEPPYRIIHQERGVELNARLLDKIKFPEHLKAHILEIISQHDTRKGFYSPEDGVVRDADKLWRFTLYHWEELFLKQRKMTPFEASKQLIDWVNDPNFFYSGIAREIAELEAYKFIIDSISDEIMQKIIL